MGACFAQPSLLRPNTAHGVPETSDFTFCFFSKNHNHPSLALIVVKRHSFLKKEDVADHPSSRARVRRAFFRFYLRGKGGRPDTLPYSLCLDPGTSTFALETSDAPRSLSSSSSDVDDSVAWFDRVSLCARFSCSFEAPSANSRL